MPYYHVPDYLDNTPHHNLGHALNRLILDLEERRLDIATGYFEPEVWRQVADAFQTLDGLRLLLGKEPALEPEGDDRVDLRAFLRRRLQGDLEALQFNREAVALVESLVEFLQRDAVQVRVYPRFLHAKAYIFPHHAIVGSSNFTPSGLNRKAELNLVQKSDTIARALRDEWFASFWAEAEDYKADLIDALNRSKFGVRPYTPYDVFIKVLYEYFRDRLLPDAPEAAIGVNLATFQQEGLRDAIRLLDRYHGVIIADAVGLGKTYIGMGLLEYYLIRKRRRGYIPKGLVVCPAQLRDLVWGPKLDEYGIKARIVSMEEMGRQDFEYASHNMTDFVLVDESHNFRNPAANRYQSLYRLLSTGKRDKDVALMTATPINNSVWDLYHQIMLLTRGTESFYRTDGITNLRGFFARVADRSAELFDLLELTAVRRSRYDIRKRQAAGEEIRLPGRGPIRFPTRQLRALTYDLEQTYRGFYDEIAAQIESLTLVSYNIEEFKTARDETEVQKNQAIIGILKTTLLKRLESSLRAFEVSVQRQRAFQQRFFTELQQGRLLKAADYRKLVSLEADEDSEGAQRVLETLETVEASAYNLVAIQVRLEADIQAFNDMQGWLDIVREAKGGLAAQDAKLDAVKAELAGPLHGQKVLIFTYYHDTARYLHDSLQADAVWRAMAGAPRLALISGATPPQERTTLVKRFAPRANTPEDEAGARERRALQADEIQILISTDVLSEGQNLQDAGILINYDLHWNPVRMIQRAGRIDRLGTRFDTLTILNCFPEQGLESLLGLVARLQRRIADIDRTVGLDASVLGEMIHERSLEELKRLKSGDARVLDDLEQAAELVSTDEMKLPLILYLQSLGERHLDSIPLGIHSGKRAPVPGVFFAFRAQDRHFWRFYPSGGGDVVTDKRRIFNWLQSTPETPRVMPAQVNIFEWLERATADLLRELKSRQIAARVRPPMSGLNKQFYDILNQATLLEEVPDELRRRVSQVLLDVSLRPFQRQAAMRDVQAAFKQDHSVRTLAERLDAFFVDNDLYRDYIEPGLLEAVQESDLQLIGYEWLSAAT